MKRNTRTRVVNNHEVDNSQWSKVGSRGILHITTFLCGMCSLLHLLQLPGEPSNIVALGGGKAEMTTSSGAIYYTKNAGMNWSAQVCAPRLLSLLEEDNLASFVLHGAVASRAWRTRGACLHCPIQLCLSCTLGGSTVGFRWRTSFLLCDLWLSSRWPLVR